MNVLIVHPSRKLGDQIRIALEVRGYPSSAAMDAAGAQALLQNTINRFDLVLAYEEEGELGSSIYRFAQGLNINPIFVFLFAVRAVKKAGFEVRNFLYRSGAEALLVELVMEIETKLAEIEAQQMRRG